VPSKRLAERRVPRRARLNPDNRRYRIVRNHPPTDLEILKEIYRRHYSSFAAYSRKSPNRDSKIYVPVDLDAIAARVGVDVDIVFGRLYYSLNKKHGYRNDDGSYVHLFTPVAGKDRDCVNFPLLASVLADLGQENRKFWWATLIAVFSLVVSIISIVIALYT
jgi:hypothetical protein